MAVPSDPIKAICKLLQSAQYRHDTHRLFSDCMETAAIAISNAVDLRQRDAREARYMEIVGRYDRETVEMFPRVLAELTLALEEERRDVLGLVFGELGVINTVRGQFFTPYPVCRAMAAMTLGGNDDAKKLIEEKGFISAMEPACGAGAMVIALADALHAQGINYQQYLHVTAVDIDPRAVHMAYLQFSLLHIPAHVVVGNSLSLETRENWYTPAHILGGWNAKLAKAEATRGPIAPPPPAADPPPAAPRGQPEPYRAPSQLSLF